jgi:autotransporter-associated beta strand protein
MVLISGGTVTVDNTVTLPYWNGKGVLTVSANGTFRRTSGASGLNINSHGNGKGEVNLIGGSIDNAGGSVNFGSGSGAISGGWGIVNLDAGTFATARFAHTLGNSRLNFNGATLRPSGNRTDFIPGNLTSVYVNGPFGSFTGGAVLDSAGFTNTIAANLLASSGDGVSTLAVATAGSGYIGAPYVSIVDSPTVGFGATAIANMVDDGTGNGTLKVDSIKVTNPGINYTAGTTTYTFTGGRPTTAATAGAVTLASNTSGGLTKIGTGAFILSGDSTYTGGTTVSNGTMLVNNISGSGTGSGAVTVKTNATLGGNGTISGAVTIESGSYLAPGAGIGTLTLGGNLTTLSGTNTMEFEITGPSTGDKLVVGGNLSPGGRTIISLPSPTPLANGDYTLVEVTGTLGGSASNFSVTSPNPTKIYEIVYESGTPNRVLLRISSAATLLTWTGGDVLANNVWNLVTATNWVKSGGAPTGFSDNDGVMFDDTGAYYPVVDIAAAVSPLNVTVNASSDYAFTGAGGIAGPSAFIKMGSGALTLSNANTFSGGVTMSAGTLNLNHSAAPGTGKLTITGGTLDNTSGGALTLANNNPQVWDGDFSFTGSSDLNLGTGAVASSANRTVTVNNNRLTVGGGITGTAGLTKVGAGTLILGGTNTYAGGTTNSAGSLTLTGSLANSAGAVTVDAGKVTVSGAMSTGTGAWTVGGWDKAVLNVTPGAAIMKNGGFFIGALSGSSGAVNVTGGSFTNLMAWSFNNFSVGGSGYGALTVSGGNVDTRGFLLGSVSGASGMGMVSISGGTVTVDNSVTIPYFAGTGVLTVSTNGNFKRTAGTGYIAVNNKGDGRGEFNLTGGTVDNANGVVGFGSGPSAVPGGSGIVNLDAGTFTTVRFLPVQGASRLNFSGATLRASTSATDFIPGTMTSVYVNGPFGSFAGGAVIDTAGHTNTIAANLLAPTGAGVSGLAVADGGVGYIGAPYVSIVDNNGTGFGATAIANMVDDGTGNGTLKVDSIKVTNPGIDYTAGMTAYTFAGGGPTTTATPGAVTLTANTSGGLTKDGAGVLSLSGENTYTGPTLVNAGVLAINGSLAAGSAVTVTGGALAGNGLIGGPVTVLANGVLAPGMSIGTLTITNTLTLSVSSTNLMELDKGAGTNDVVAADTVSYGGMLVVTNLAGTLAAGDTFKLFTAGSHSNNFAGVVLQGDTLKAQFDPASGILLIVPGTVTTPTNISFSFSDGTLALSWPASHLGWYAQSNSVSIVDSNAWQDIPGSQSVTSLVIPVEPTTPKVFYRLRNP